MEVRGGIHMMRRRYAALPLLMLFVLLYCLVAAARPASVAAHPLGNFTINRYSKLVFSADVVTITYVLDFAEIPTFQEMRLLDQDGDGALSEAEGRAYLDARLPELVENLRLVVAGRVLELRVDQSAASFVPGQGGLPTLRLDLQLSAPLPEGWQEKGLGGYTDRNYNDRLGWREIVIQGGQGVEIAASSVSATDVTNGLRTYPEDLLTSPLNHSEATFTLAPGDGTVAPAGDAAGEASQRLRDSTNGGRATDRVANLITARDLTPTVIVVSLALAMFWGSVHALTPGHGKTVVAAYLVGARGTAQHAAFLGLTVTLTHTAGVFALGLVTLYLSHYILPETLYPWLNVVSGALVVAIGVSLAWRRWRSTDHAHAHDHSHDHAHEADPAHAHTHAHGGHIHTHTHDGTTHSHVIPGADGTPVTWRSLLALGVSGGLIPCPSALVLLLAAISLGRLEFGMLLVVAFSLGLAGVLTGIGLLLVYARRLFERFSLEPRIPRLLPVGSALVITLAGLALMLESLRQAGIV
ncbi:MAG: high-affinity nickel-transporter [Chloroflexi bacterium]|nr:MAG: high-affinity nickel-transporter [Chloroflexota bacterium]